MSEQTLQRKLTVLELKDITMKTRQTQIQSPNFIRSLMSKNAIGFFMNKDIKITPFQRITKLHRNIKLYTCNEEVLDRRVTTVSGHGLYLEALQVLLS